MIFAVDRTKTLMIDAGLDANAIARRARFTLNRNIGGVRTPIANSGALGCDHTTFTFVPDQLVSWDPQSLLEVDVLVSYLGPTTADFLLDVVQYGPDGHSFVPCARAGMPATPFKVDKEKEILRTGAFTIGF